MSFFLMQSWFDTKPMARVSIERRNQDDAKGKHLPDVQKLDTKACELG